MTDEGSILDRARETATTSKEGSNRANYPILTQGGSDKKSQYSVFTTRMNKLQNLSTGINLRGSQVPAAAVVPAPMAFIVVAAVGKLVVGLLQRTVGPPLRVTI